jgi:hypothetical protein
MAPQPLQIPSTLPSFARLRTTTGCLKCSSISYYAISLFAEILFTGRDRRKKCDEKKPRCGACSRLNFQCRWMALEKSQDNGYSSHGSTVSPKPNLGVVWQPVSGAVIQGAVSSFIGQWPVANLKSSWTGFDCAIVLYPTASRSSAFSNALEAVSLLTAFLSVRKPGVDLKQSAVQSYGRALRAINIALSDPKQLTIDHTLGAIELICLFEVLNLSYWSSRTNLSRPLQYSLPQRQT